MLLLNIATYGINPLVNHLFLIGYIYILCCNGKTLEKFEASKLGKLQNNCKQSLIVWLLYVKYFKINILNWGDSSITGNIDIEMLVYPI